MSKIELIEQSSDIFIPEDFLVVEDLTITDSAKSFMKRNKSPLLTYIVSGTLLLMSSHECVMANQLPLINSIENIDSFLKDYNNIIDTPISEYLEQVNCITHKVSYSKNDIIKEILSFKALNNNWNGYGAYPLEIESATNSIVLIDLIGESLFSMVKEFYPNPNGTISFEWTNNSNEILSLEVGNKSMSYYLDLSSKETLFCNNKLINVEEAKKISDYIRLL